MTGTQQTRTQQTQQAPTQQAPTQQAPTQQVPPDLRPLLLHACDRADTLVATVDDDDLARPTPCAEYDVQGLLDHLVMVARRIRIVLGGGHFSEATPSGATTGEELRAAWRQSLDELRAAAPGFDLAAPVTAPFGTMPGGAALGFYVSEVAVHSWDLARSLDRSDLLDPELAEPLVAPVRDAIPAQGREEMPFGAVVEVPGDAPAYDRLVAWMGRDPAWSSAVDRGRGGSSGRRAPSRRAHPA